MNEAQHKIIRTEQQLVSKPFADSNPSETDDVFWIYAKRKVEGYPPSTSRSGKWLVFAPVEKIDEIWKQIKQATEEGRLGGSAKVSTMLTNPNAKDSNTKVICVYTYDSADEEDVMRVRDVLRHLGHTQVLNYKTDQATREGKYEVTGHKGISEYRQ